MKDFDYEKAYFTRALPAFNNLSNKQKEAHSALLLLVADLRQGKDLNIPLTEEMQKILDSMTCQDLAEMSNSSYFVGHWKPGLVSPVFENSKGQSWKITNVCDQALRNRFKADLPYNVLIHDGKFRVTFSNKNCWIWEEFGLATEKNLEIFKTCGLQFGELTLNESAKTLSDLCGDLWGDIETTPSNAEYNAFLLVKKEKDLENLKARHAKKLSDIEKDIKNSQIELEAFTWLINNNIPAYFIDNCIYYSHTGKFSFGWQSVLSEKEKEQLTGMLVDFPYVYEFHK
jgi:hypothetical protein